MIRLSEGHLQNLPMGSWLRFFDLDYSPDAPHLKLQVIAKLQADATLLEQYVYEEQGNNVGVRSWDFKGMRIKEEYYRGGEWEGPTLIPAQEFYQGGPAENLWISIEFERGIRYSELIPDHYQLLNEVRDYEHAVTIEAPGDQNRRLFLFGYGRLCRRISLF